jgi:hypothetical protein
MHWALLLGEQIEDAPPHRMRNRGEDFCLPVIMHSAIIRKQKVTCQAPRVVTRILRARDGC